MIVAVETENPAKLKAVDVAFREAFPNAGLEVRQVVCGLDTPEQPLDEAIAIGAHQRARAAVETPDADYGVGIEAGLLALPGSENPFSIQVCVIMDRDGTASVGLGPGYQLPKDLLQAVMHGASLRDAFERLLNEDDPNRHGAVYYLSGGRIDRTELTVQAVRMALGPRTTDSPGVNRH